MLTTISDVTFAAFMECLYTEEPPGGALAVTL